MNLVRLVELIGFVLGHTTVGPDAQLLEGAIFSSPGLDKISRPVILAPVLGIITNLYMSGSSMIGRKLMQESINMSGEHGLWAGPLDDVPTISFLKQLVSTNSSCSVDAFKYLHEMEWSETFPDDRTVFVGVDSLKDFIQQLEKYIAESQTEGQHGARTYGIAFIYCRGGHVWGTWQVRRWDA